jgi:hypothetical protein
MLIKHVSITYRWISLSVLEIWPCCYRGASMPVRYLDRMKVEASMILTVGLGDGVVLFTYKYLWAQYRLKALEVKDIFDGYRTSHWRGVHDHKETWPLYFLYVTRTLNHRFRMLVRHVIKYTIFEVVKTVLMTTQGSCNVTARHIFSSRYGVYRSRPEFSTAHVFVYRLGKPVFLVLWRTI